MSVLGKALKWLVTTPEGCTILGAAAFGGGYLIGSYIGERQIKREKEMYETGVQAGMLLHEGGYSIDDIEVIMEQDPGIFGKRRIRTIKKQMFDVKNDEKTAENGENSSSEPA